MNRLKPLLILILLLSASFPNGLRAEEEHPGECNGKCLSEEVVLAILDYIHFDKLFSWGKPISSATLNESKYLGGSFGIRYRFDEGESKIETILAENNLVVESMWIKVEKTPDTRHEVLDRTYIINLKDWNKKKGQEFYYSSKEILIKWTKLAKGIDEVCSETKSFPPGISVWFKQVTALVQTEFCRYDIDKSLFNDPERLYILNPDPAVDHAIREWLLNGNKPVGGK
ncbi:hypothetical protein ACFL4G_11825 [Thermodesulfobacteriota bacterium]